jgi:2Fe-2S ferredoxin
MVQIVFLAQNGERIAVDAQQGESMMSAAKNAGVPGIDADCGGCMVCGTCHVYVDPTWHDRLPPKSEMELALLDCVPEPHPHARLSCQLPVTEALDGITVTVPAAQR